MSNATLALVFGWTGMIMGVAQTLLQADRIRRDGTEGVSLLTWGLFLAGNWYWIAFGLGTHSMPIFIGSIINVFPMLYLLALVGWHQVRRPIAQSSLIVAIVVGVPAAIGGWTAGLIASGALAVGLRVPQIRALYRTTTARGVSVTSWIVSATNCSLWMLYGLFDRRWALFAMNSALVALNVVIAVLAVERHRTLHRLERNRTPVSVTRARRANAHDTR